jgi:hypothetical protein
VLWIWIHWIRIRFQYFKWIRILGFDDQKLEKNTEENFLYFFFDLKLQIYVSLDLHKGEVFSPQKRHPALQKWNLLSFSIYVGNFWLPGSEIGIPIEFGSGSTTLYKIVKFWSGKKRRRGIYVLFKYEWWNLVLVPTVLGLASKLASTTLQGSTSLLYILLRYIQKPMTSRFWKRRFPSNDYVVYYTAHLQRLLKPRW